MLQCYIMLKYYAEAGQTYWDSNIRKLLNMNRLGYVWENQSVDSEELFRLSFTQLLTLRLHYVPGDHGSHGSPKLNPRRHDGVLRLSSRYVKDACTFPHGLSRSDGTSHVSVLHYRHSGSPKHSPTCSYLKVF